uniref:Uncharacterized protein n=1 Tax=Setaria italica TaxID=4555 RepID=K4API4_SETIT
MKLTNVKDKTISETTPKDCKNAKPSLHNVKLSTIA